MTLISGVCASLGWSFDTPCFQTVQDCPLSLWERVGVREPRGKQAVSIGNEWERQGYWGPSPGVSPLHPAWIPAFAEG